MGYSDGGITMRKSQHAIFIFSFVAVFLVQAAEDNKKAPSNWPLVASGAILDQHIFVTAKGGTFHSNCSKKVCMHEDSLRRAMQARNTHISDEVITSEIRYMCHWDRVFCATSPCMVNKLARLTQSIVNARGNIEFSHAAGGGYTPLHAAVRQFQARYYSPYDMTPYACTQALLKQGALVNTRNMVGRTPLITTLVGTRSDCPQEWVNYLIGHAADVNSVVPGDAVPYSFGGDDTFSGRRDSRAIVPVYIAARRAWRSENYRTIVQTLLAAKADVAWVDDQQQPMIDRVVNDRLLRDSEAGIMMRREYKEMLAPLFASCPPIIAQIIIAYMIGTLAKQSRVAAIPVSSRLIEYDEDTLQLPKIQRKKVAR